MHWKQELSNTNESEKLDPTPFHILCKLDEWKIALMRVCVCVCVRVNTHVCVRRRVYACMFLCELP